MLKDIARRLDAQSRRDFLSATARTCLGVSVIGGFNLARAAAADEAEKPSIAPRKNPAKSVIYLYFAGGMSHIDTWDPKTGGETAGKFSPLKTNVAGIELSSELPALARHADKMCLIRSMTSTQGAHERAQYLMHTSYAPLASVKHPGMGPWVTKLGGKLNEKLPGAVVIGGNRDGGAGVLGSAYEPITVGNPQTGLANSKMRTTEGEFDHRRKLLDSLDQGFRARYPQEAVQSYTRFYQEAVELMKSDDLNAFDISKESAETKAAYGASNFGMGCLLARRLVESGVRFVEVTLGGWDTHQDNFEELEEKLPPMDKAVAALLDDLKKKGLLDSVVVACASDFGRTPKVNERDGRDHYPKVFTTMLAGGGIKGGQVYGASDDRGAAVKEKPVTPQDFNATIAYSLGLSTTKQVFSKIGRPFTIADHGQPLVGIF